MALPSITERASSRSREASLHVGIELLPVFLSLFTLLLELVPVVHQVRHEVGLVSDLLPVVYRAFSMLKCLQLGQWPLASHLYLAKHVQIAILQEELNQVEALQYSAVLERW